jgi:hypothetical protein
LTVKWISLLAVLLVVLISAPVIAQPIDPDPDGMSFYFDTEGTEYCMTVDDWEPAPYAGFCVNAFLLVTHPDTPFPRIHGWEAHIGIETNAPSSHVNLLPGMADMDGDPDDYVIGGYGPTITGDATVIAWVRLRWYGFEGHAEASILLRGVDGSLSFPDGPGYWAEVGNPSPCQPLFDDWGACAWIGNDCTTPNEGMTWGAVKRLY